MLKIIPTKEAKKYHYDYVSKKFNDIIDDGFINRGNPNEKKYLPKCFLKFLSNNFNEIINEEPNKLLEIHKEFLKLSFSKEEMNLIKSFLFETGYNNFSNKEFLNLLNIDTCTYCNRNYTLQFDLETNHARAQLDHWFPKETFPILALSFYNLIPSCSSCNHIKGSAKTYDWENALKNIVHPYFNPIEFLFSYEYKDFNEPKTKLKPNKNCIKNEETIKFNKLREIYESNSERELKDLLDLRYKYSKNYLDILCNRTFESLNLSQEEAYRMIFGIEIKEQDFHKRPFSKFKKDIIEELLKKVNKF